MNTIYYNKDGWICDRGYEGIDNTYQGSIEVSDEEFEDSFYTEAYYAWRVVDNKLVNQIFQEKQWTQEERLEERTKLHEKTDADYAKYSRQVRCNVDMPYSQQVLDYIDQYNLQVSDTVNQPNFPQEVTYPEYKLP